MAQQIQIRRDTATNWSSANPILAQGEFGLETNTGKLKIGNGTSAWNSLTYFGGAGALASLTDVSISSLASGQVILSNGSSQFINLSLGSLVNQLVSFSSLGSLAVMNQLSFTSLLNQPSLSSLAFQSTVDYPTQVLNKPSLGSLAIMNQLSFTSLLNQPSLSSLAFQSSVDYQTQVTGKPSLGSLAVLNSLTKSDVGLSNVTNDAQLKIASNLSDLNNIETARGNLSLGSLAVLNTVSAVLPSTASLDILYSNGIVNSSTVSTNFLYANNLFASTISTGILNAIGGVFASTVSTNIIQARGGVFASTASIRNIRGVTATFTGDISAFNLSGTNTGDQTMPFWGDGSDGTVILDGSIDSQYYPFLTYNAATSTYTLTRDVYAYDFTLYVGYTLITAGYRIFALTSLSNGGTIHNNGYNASGASAGAGGLGGFFRAGGAGTNGLPATNSGASGTFPTLPLANTFLGNVGGRGANGRSGTVASAGQNNSLSSLAGPLYGGKQLVGNYYTYQEPFIQANASVSALATFSAGGGAGAKSVVGTTALSGGGGGGGGVVFLASPLMTSSGTISSTGGNGGNATGTGGVFGGGGGGAGGVVMLHYNTSNPMGSLTTPIVTGGTGGNSAGNANTLAVGRSDGSVYLSTATVQTFSFTPNQAINYGSYYIMSIHMTFDAGTTSIGFNAGAVTGFDCSWSQLADVRFNSIANPTRALFVFKGRPTATTTDQLQNNKIVAKCVGPVNTVRIVLDEIQNTSEWEGNDPSNTLATNSSDSATVGVTNLGVTPTTNNMQYSVVATSGGTAFVAGTGLTMLNTAGTTAPILQTGVTISRASSAISWTTAAAYGMMTIDLNQPSAQETGRPGFDGRIIQFYA